MFRPAVFQIARCTSRRFSSMPPRVPRIVALYSRTTSNRPSLSTSYNGARFYSAPAGLERQEVEGRIMDLLKNFDKVGSYNSYPIFSVGLNCL